MVAGLGDKADHVGDGRTIASAATRISTRLQVLMIRRLGRRELVCGNSISAVAAPVATERELLTNLNRRGGDDLNRSAGYSRASSLRRFADWMNRDRP
jgi:hypothetical protein